MLQLLARSPTYLSRIHSSVSRKLQCDATSQSRFDCASVNLGRQKRVLFLKYNRDFTVAEGNASDDLIKTRKSFDKATPGSELIQIDQKNPHHPD
ncbi:hypothetical protein RRG08_021025 [Elysia crispata]|uniref:Uncharacterized protein n=1 Tax=Elysia crispata TaxID=231223 RepID=A0AAE0ZRK1_9GAST|nr:hypothetical protein RRG08_021025 [Elysia crispata]